MINGFKNKLPSFLLCLFATFGFKFYHPPGKTGIYSQMKQIILICLALSVLLSCSKHDPPQKALNVLLNEGLESNDIDLVKKVMESSAFPKELIENTRVGKFKDLPLFWAFRESPDFEMVRILVENGAEIDMRDMWGNTVLMLAAGFGDLDSVKYLVSRGSDINSKDDTGGNALLGAAGMTVAPFDMEAQNRDSYETVKFLTEAGSAVDDPNDNGTTPLMQASWAAHLETVKYLVSCGADIRARDINGETPLMNAAGSNKYRNLTEREKNQLMAIGKAMAAGARGDSDALIHEYEYNITNSGVDNGKGQLELLEVVQYLVSKGVDRNVRNHDGKTAAELAEDMGNWGIAEYLNSLSLQSDQE